MATCVHISLSSLLGIIHPLLSSPKLVSMSEVDPFFEELPFAPIAPLLALYIQPNMFTRGLMLVTPSYPSADQLALKARPKSFHFYQ